MTSEAAVFPSPFAAPATSNKVSKTRVRHGRWSAEEQTLFERAFAMHGKEWRLIADAMQTRTVVQVRTHAQKYFQRVAKETNTPVMSTSNKPRFQPLPYSLNFPNTHHNSGHFSVSSTNNFDNLRYSSSASEHSTYSTASSASVVSTSSVQPQKQYHHNSHLPSYEPVFQPQPTQEPERLVSRSKRLNIENDKREIQTYLQKGTEEEVLAAAFLLSNVSNVSDTDMSSNGKNKRRRVDSEVSDFKLQWADGVLSTTVR